MAEKSSLQQVREAAGLSVEQISAITKIRAGVIRDLENNSVEVCGGIAYARGHVRTIAKALNSKTGKAINIDVDILVAELEASQSIESKKIIDQLSENHVPATVPHEKKRMKFGTLAAISVTTLSIGFIAQIAINNVAAISDGVTTVSVKKPSVQESTSEIVLPDGVNLVLTGVYGETWVGLTNADGQSIFNGHIAEGQIAAFNDLKILKVVIGNAGAVKLNLNGTDLGVAGADGEVVRLDFDENGQL
jgi:transcriptional regulator with XRE-family HTH domain